MDDATRGADAPIGAPIEAPIIGGQRGYVVPLVVAVTGHRDLVPAELPAIRDRVRQFLLSLQEERPERAISVMTSLAEGADRLVADVALALDIPLTVPLPMAADLYVDDFETPASRDEFRRLCEAAAEIFALPLTPGNTPQSIAASSANRARQYAQLGVFICAHCHILLALWDGKDSDALGGTAQVVRFHHDDVMPGYTPRATASRLTLTDDESDLVYHIVCSRAGRDGRPAEGLEALDCWWFTKDETSPRSKEMPERHGRVFDHTSEFSRDARIHEQSIAGGAWPLAAERDSAVIPRGAHDIDHVFRVADWLAIHFQRRRLLSLRTTHLLALLMGGMYILYEDVLPMRAFVIAFVVFFVIAAGVHRIGARRAWHRKYLDYRTLAEGLRVQYYWAVAGVTSGNVSKFAHDNFLQMQDPDLGWIRNVMRVAGTECDVAPNRDAGGVSYSIREWIGDENSGQIGYYGRKSRERLRRHRRTERFAMLVLWLSIIAVTLFVFAPDELADFVRDPVVALLGFLLLAVGVRQSYSFSSADSELIKQYEFMHRIFVNARRRILQCRDDDQRRRVLKALGEAALDEHSEWILMHRERSVDKGEVWRMSSG